MIICIRVRKVKRLRALLCDIHAVRHHIECSLTDAGKTAVEIPFLELCSNTEPLRDLLRRLDVKTDQIICRFIVVGERCPVAFGRDRDDTGCLDS